MAEADLDDLDRYALNRHREVVARVLEAYDAYEFHVVYHQLVQYCAADLSSFYLDVLKDRLYCDGAASARRRSAQTVMHRMVRDLALLLAPVLPFTSDEIWPLVPGPREGSVHLALLPAAGGTGRQACSSAGRRLLEVRAAVTKALEEARGEADRGQPGGARDGQGPRRRPGRPPPPRGEEPRLPRQPRQPVHREPGRPRRRRAATVAVEVARAAGAKCERCWTYSAKVGRLPAHPAVCERCAAVLESAMRAPAAPLRADHGGRWWPSTRSRSGWWTGPWTCTRATPWWTAC